MSLVYKGIDLPEKGSRETAQQIQLDNLNVSNADNTETKYKAWR